MALFSISGILWWPRGLKLKLPLATECSVETIPFLQWTIPLDLIQSNEKDRCGVGVGDPSYREKVSQQIVSSLSGPE